MKQSYKEFLKYGIVGVIGLGVEWLSFFFFRDYLGINYIVSHILSCVLAIINNFFLNSYFTFNATDKIIKRGLSFFGIAGVGIVVSTILLPILVRIYNIGLEQTDLIEVSQKTVQSTAKLSCTAIVAFLQFFFNKYYTFKKKDQ